MANEKIEALKRVPLFARCSKRELEFLAGEMDEARVGAGENLLTEGALGQGFYVVLEGEVEVTKGGKHRRDLGSGQFFGEISMVDRGPATATVTAKTPLRVLVLSHRQFADAIRANHELSLVVMESMATRLREDETTG